MLIFAAMDASTGDYKIITDLSKSQRGLKCNCICSGCGKRLVAKMGQKKTPHFAHQSDSESKGAVCVEASIRLLGKALISKMSFFDVKAGANEFYQRNPLVRKNYMGGVKIYDYAPFLNGSLEIVEANVDKRLDNLTSDVLVKARYGDREININFEICLNHESTNTKIKNIGKENVTTIEIDLGSLLGDDRLTIDKFVKAIESKNNQRLVYLDSDTKRAFDRECEDYGKGQGASLLQEVHLWMDQFKTRYSNGSPIVIHDNLSDVKNIVRNATNKYGRKVFIDDQIPEFPKVPSRINVQSVDVHDGSMVLNCIFGKAIAPLPILLTDDDGQPLIVDDSHLEIMKDSHLLISLRSVISNLRSKRFFSKLDIKWGRNKKVEDWREVALSELERKILESECSQRKATIKTIADLTAPGYKHDFMPSRNCRKLASEQLGISEKNPVLNHIVQNKFDEVGVLGCHSSDWQYLFITYLSVRNQNVQLDYGNFLLWLEHEHGIKMRLDCKELMYNSKVIKELKLEIPFKTPFVMLKEYRLFLRDMARRLKLKIEA